MGTQTETTPPGQCQLQNSKTTIIVSIDKQLYKIGNWFYFLDYRIISIYFNILFLNSKDKPLNFHWLCQENI